MAHLRKLTWLRLDFRRPKKSAHLLHQILHEIVSARRPGYTFALHLSIEDSDIEDIGAWDHTLWSFGRYINRLKLWIRSQSVNAAIEEGMQYGRQPNRYEKKLIQASMPMIWSIGLFMFDTYRGSSG